MTYAACPNCGKVADLYSGWEPGVGFSWQVRCALPPRGGCGYGTRLCDTAAEAAQAWAELVDVAQRTGTPPMMPGTLGIDPADNLRPFYRTQDRPEQYFNPAGGLP